MSYPLSRTEAILMYALGYDVELDWPLLISATFQTQ